jgi:hypothetical protein
VEVAEVIMVVMVQVLLDLEQVEAAADLWEMVEMGD